MVIWENEGKNSLWLFTPAEFAQLPDGIEVESIMGNKKIKGKDDIDDDTRGGYLAWGVRGIETHEHSKLLLTFLIKRKSVAV